MSETQFLDLDNFKQVNDALGHEFGDQLLQSVADRLVASVRSTDTVCRQGGDEFVILLSEIEHPRDAGHFAEGLLSAFSAPHCIDTLKIDPSFAHDMVTDTIDSAIVTAVISIGNNLNLRVIAEGVETPEQLAFIKHQRCDEGQGFYFSHALSAEAFGLLLKTGKN